MPYFGRNTEFLCCSLFPSFHPAHSWMAFVRVREQACSTSGKWLSSRADCTPRLLPHLPRKQTACPGTSNACLEALRPHSLAGRAPNPSGPPQPRPAPGGAGPAPGRSGAASCLPAPGGSGCGGERALTGTRRFLYTRTRSRPGELRNGEGGCREGWDGTGRDGVGVPPPPRSAPGTIPLPLSH